ncbi:RNA-binding [Fusarium albosuccineum]|uniref:RNA-binding n=1 Tax=Fusarium albosuccineum TaxID=1237068 RepID=A0A8H4L338_9HYPO|nr:RNA-binding [Fusarium albosuccineum]
MASSGWQRPPGSGQESRQVLRNTVSFANLKQEDSDSDTESTSKPHGRRAFSEANGFPRKRISDDDESPSYDDSFMSRSDDVTDLTPTESSTAQESADKENMSAGELITNEDAATAVAELSREIDAQALYSPDACVFVANLAQNQDDLHLQSEVTKVFGRFGTVFVKIKRDKRFMPFAFCQFTKPFHADRALAEGRGLEILGRPCRTEKCNGNLVYIVCRRNRRAVQHEEARTLLEPYGVIAWIKDLDRAIQVRLKLPPSVLVQYEMFDARRDVAKALGHNTIFVVMPYDAKVAQDPSERDPSDVTFMEAYDKDRRSAFFGGLPMCTDEDFVRSLASVCGTVLSVQIKSTSDIHTGLPNSFAFVEFDRPDAPDEAVRIYNGRMVHGLSLRVERKRTKTPMTTPVRATSFGPIPPNRPHRRTTSTYSTYSAYSNSSNDRLVLPHRPYRANNNALVPMNAQHQSVEGQYPRQPHLNHTPQRVFSPRTAAIIASQELPDDSPMPSPLRPSPLRLTPRRPGAIRPSSMVRFAPSPVPLMSPSSSSSVEFHHPKPISPVRKPSVLGPSFSDRMAGNGRAVTYDFSLVPETAADRLKMASEETHKTLRRGEESMRQIDQSLMNHRDFSRYIEHAVKASRAKREAEQNKSSDDTEDWTDCTESVDEQAALEDKTGSNRSLLLRAHLSAENLKRNKLSEERLKRSCRSEDNLRRGRYLISIEDLRAPKDGKSVETSVKVVKKSYKSPGTESTHTVPGRSSARTFTQHDACTQTVEPVPHYVPMIQHYAPQGYHGMTMHPMAHSVPHHMHSQYGYMPAPYAPQLPYPPPGQFVYQGYTMGHPAPHEMPDNTAEKPEKQRGRRERRAK